MFQKRLIGPVIVRCLGLAQSTVSGGEAIEHKHGCWESNPSSGEQHTEKEEGMDCRDAPAKVVCSSFWLTRSLSLSHSLSPPSLPPSLSCLSSHLLRALLAIHDLTIKLH